MAPHAEGQRPMDGISPCDFRVHGGIAREMVGTPVFAGMVGVLLKRRFLEMEVYDAVLRESGLLHGFSKSFSALA